MARTDPQVNFRIPAELLERVKLAASENSRTITAELVSRLEESFASKSMDEMTIKDVIDAAVNRSIEKAQEFMVTRSIEHFVPRAIAGPSPDNLMIMSQLEHELMSIDDSAHRLLGHANAIALVHGEDHEAYQRLMKDAADLRRIEEGLRDTFEDMARAARKKSTAPKRKAK